MATWSCVLGAAGRELRGERRARPNPDSALVSAGAEMKWRNGFSLAATFEGELSSNTTSYSGKGVARYTW
jgi:uncharacterized protein with beta-barrel porin domain